MYDKVEYDRCPICLSKDISKKRRGDVMVIRCMNDAECGNIIDIVSIEEPKHED